MSEANKTPCAIEEVGKSRNGKSRFWCTAHGSNATGRYGTKLPQCEAAYRDVDPAKTLQLELNNYPGGLALWGAVAPIYDTTGIPVEDGVHVHGRKVPDGEKIIDATHPAVAFNFQRELFREQKLLITSETAVSYYLSRFAGHSVECLFCTYCGEPHLDAGYFAIKPHRKHLCHGCGRYFQADHRGVSNPIAYIKSQVNPSAAEREPIFPKRDLDIAQADYPGGIQVWASNPSVLWTLDRPEECGIHIHAFKAGGRIDLDETYRRVRIDGVELPFEEVAYLMAQRSLSYLKGKVISLACENCGEPVLDRGVAAFKPAAHRVCEKCGSDVSPKKGKRLVVSNPLVAKLDRLLEIGKGSK